MVAVDKRMQLGGDQQGRQLSTGQRASLRNGTYRARDDMGSESAEGYRQHRLTLCHSNTPHTLPTSGAWP
jgi:hypothetical protein